MGQLLSLALSLVRLPWLFMRTSNAPISAADEGKTTCERATDANIWRLNTEIESLPTGDLDEQESSEEAVFTGGRSLRRRDGGVTADDFLNILACQGIIGRDIVSAPKTNRPLLTSYDRNSLASQGTTAAATSIRSNRPIIVNNYRSSVASRGTNGPDTGSRMPNRPVTANEYRNNLRNDGIVEVDTGLRQSNRPVTVNYIKDSPMSKGTVGADARLRQQITQPAPNNLKSGVNNKGTVGADGGSPRQPNRQPAANDFKCSITSKGTVGTDASLRQGNRQPAANDFKSSITSKGTVGTDASLRQPNRQPAANDFKSSITSKRTMGIDASLGLPNIQPAANEFKSSLMSKGTVGTDGSLRQSIKPKTADDFLSILANTGIIGPGTSTRKKDRRSTLDEFTDSLASETITETDTSSSKRKKPVTADDFLNILAGKGVIGQDVGLGEDKWMPASDNYADKLANQEITEKELRMLKHQNKPVIGENLIEKLLSHESIGSDFGVPGFGNHARTSVAVYNAEVRTNVNLEPGANNRTTPVDKDTPRQGSVSSRHNKQVAKPQASKETKGSERNRAAVMTDHVAKALVKKDAAKRDPSEQGRRNRSERSDKTSTSKETTRQGSRSTRRDRTEDLSENTASVNTETASTSTNASSRGRVKPITADDFLKRLVSEGIMDSLEVSLRSMVKASTSSSQHSGIVGASRREKPTKVDAFVSNLDTLISEGTLDVLSENSHPASDRAGVKADTHVATSAGTRVQRDDSRPITGDDFVRKLVSDGVLEPDMDVFKRNKLVTAVDSVFKEMTKRLSRTPISVTELWSLTGASSSRQ